jgi:hypothetical protein
MNSYQLISNQATNPNKWRARIEKRRRDKGGGVLDYVDQIIRESKVPVHYRIKQPRRSDVGAAPQPSLQRSASIEETII